VAIPKTNPIPGAQALTTGFTPLEDSRCPINRRHRLSDMIVLAIAAVLTGADGRCDCPGPGTTRAPKWRVMPGSLSQQARVCSVGPNGFTIRAVLATPF
jgi:hypothetical protein